MSFFKLLGIQAKEPDETETVRRLIRKMEGLEPQLAKSYALFACILCRIANANLGISREESDKMEAILSGIGRLTPDLSALVVEIAKVQNQLLGGIENYLFTREFCTLSTPEERLRLLDCLFAVAAADGSIDTHEEAEIKKIADELMIGRQDLAAIRSRYRNSLAVLQKESPKS